VFAPSPLPTQSKKKPVVEMHENLKKKDSEACMKKVGHDAVEYLKQKVKFNSTWKLRGYMIPT
jgi:hypothetical protein